MKILRTDKDGGDKSHVWAHWLIEWKSMFSIVLLRFEDGTREAYHDHAFNCFSWILKGKLKEKFLDGEVKYHTPSFKPFITSKSDFHKVSSEGRSWALSFRGPWSDTWSEVDESGKDIKLTHGRVIL